MFAFEEAFGVPAGHTLREVASVPLARPGVAGGWRWEHEEYDARGALVAVYESWAYGGGGEAASPGSGHRGGFVKYSPHGWVLSRSGTPPRVVAGREAEGAAAPARPAAPWRPVEPGAPGIGRATGARPSTVSPARTDGPAAR